MVEVEINSSRGVTARGGALLSPRRMAQNLLLSRRVSLRAMLHDPTLGEKRWSASRTESRIPRTLVLKLKTSEFKILIRSHTLASPPSSCEELTEIALRLRERVDLGPHRRYRLVGVGLSNFRDAEETTGQPTLFE